MSTGATAIVNRSNTRAPKERVAGIATESSLVNGNGVPKYASSKPSMQVERP